MKNTTKEKRAGHNFPTSMDANHAELLFAFMKTRRTSTSETLRWGLELLAEKLEPELFLKFKEREEAAV